MASKTYDKKRSRSRTRSRSPVKSKVRSKRLLISNIPFNVSMKELKTIFKDKIGICGKVDYIDKNAKFTGSATMEFKTTDGAQKAVDELHKHAIDGREIVVREETRKDRERLGLDEDYSDKHPKDSMVDRSILSLVEQLEREGPITNSLFMANLDYSLSWQKLKDMFKEAGRVRHVELKVDSDNVSRGCGTVEFESPEEAVMAIHLFNNKNVNGREIRLRMDKSGKRAVGRLDLGRICVDDYPTPGGYNPQIRRVLEDLMTVISSPNASNNPQAFKALNELVTISQILENPQPRPMHPSLSDPYDFPRNIHDKIPPKGLGDFRSNFYNSDNGNSHNFVSPQNYESSRSSYPSKSSHMADMRYDSRERYDSPPMSRDKSSSSGLTSADIAMVEDVLTKLKEHDQVTFLKLINNVINKKSNDPQMGSSGSVNPSRFNEFNSGPSNTLLVKNIPFTFTWKDLKSSFSQSPGVVNTEILRDEFNRSKGVGLVQFQSSSDAQRCKNIMDGTLLDGRPVHIEFSHNLK